MENKLERKYGLFTAICMVVGIVIGSGVFFKAQTILQKTEGNMPLGILAWIIGGAIMIVCILAFASMAQKHEKVNGIVDYAEALVGPKYGYYVGWFMSIIYYPTLTVILAWLTARYTLVFVTSCWPNFPLLIPAAQGGCVIGPECMVLTMLYLVCAYVVNALSPKLAGKFQTTTTVIKLIPLGLMAIVGIIVGLVGPNHMLVSNFATASATKGGAAAPLLASVCATSFAYEGWIIATSINAELKDAKKNLPKALIIGGIIIIITYIAYYIGVAGGASVEVLMADGATSAFVNIFGGVLGPRSTRSPTCPTTPPSSVCCCAASGAPTSCSPASSRPGAAATPSSAPRSRASRSASTPPSCPSSPSTPCTCPSSSTGCARPRTRPRPAAM